MKCYCHYTVLIIGLFLFVSTLRVNAQGNKDVLISFVKTSSVQSSDSLYFNVLKLENISTKPLILLPKITVPDCFSLMSRIPKKLKLQPGKTKHIPFRISISKTASSALQYHLEAQILSERNADLAQTECTVNIRPKSDWLLNLDDTELIFSGEKNTRAEFQFRLVNRGNTSEKIQVSIDIPEGFKAATSNRKKNFEILLAPGRDSIVNYKLVQKQKNQDLNFSDKIRLKVYNNKNKYNKSLKVSSFSNYFDYSPIKEKPNSYIVYSRRSFNGLKEIKDELNFKGIVPLKNDNKLIYSFTNYDLVNKEEFWERSYYQLVFEGKNFSGGIGQHYSNLLLDAYNPHGAFAKWKLAASKKSEIELYASQGLDYNITSVAAGHELTIDKFIIKTSLGYNEDGKRKQKSKSGIFSAEVPMGPKNKLRLSARGIERESYKDSLYTQRGIQGIGSYYGRISPRLFMNIKNRFQSKGFYSGNRADNLLGGELNYQINRRSGLFFEYAYNTKKGGTSDYDISNQQLKMAYAFKTPQNQSIKTGVWLGEYINQESDKMNEVKSLNLWMETSSRTSHLSYSLSAMAGYRFQENNIIANGEELFEKDKLPNLMLEGQATLAPFSIRCSYLNGSQKSTSLSQRSDYNELRVSTSFRKELFRDKLLVDFQADYDIDWVSKRRGLNLRPKVSLMLKNDWSILLDAYLSTYGEQTVSLSGDDLNSNFRFSLRKDFCISKKRKKEKFHKMEMVFYRDENKNGIKDKNEKGIDKTLVSINKKRKQKNEKHVSLSKLVSQNDGKVSYENIPEGYYEFDVNQLASTGGYFNFEGSKLKLNKDTICYIPYIKAYKIEGKLALKKSKISSKKVGKISNIKITATDSQGKTFSCLTSRSGYYQLPVAGKDKYVVSIHNPYGRKIKVKNNNTSVDFSENEVEEVNFEFVEKRRQVNMKKSKSPSNRKSKTLSKLPKTKMKADEQIDLKAEKKISVLNKPIVKQSNLAEKPQQAKDSLSNLDYWIYTKPVINENKKEQYWVVGGFRIEENAKNRKAILQNLGIETSIIYNEEHDLYYVFIKKVTSLMN